MVPTFAMRKPNVELTEDTHAVFQCAGQNGFMIREASSLFTASEGYSLRKTCNKLSDKFNYCSSNCEINTNNAHFEVD